MERSHRSHAPTADGTGPPARRAHGMRRAQGRRRGASDRVDRVDRGGVERGGGGGGGVEPRSVLVTLTSFYNGLDDTRKRIWRDSMRFSGPGFYWVRLEL